MRQAAVLALLLLGACQRTPEGAVGQDFALTSATITLPDDAEAWPSEVLADHCGACHSAGMVLTQPELKPEQWAATVKKMREVYKASVAEDDVPTILAALARLPAPTAATAATAP